MSQAYRTGRREDGFKIKKTLSMPKPKRWSHQDELTAAVGKKVRLVSNNMVETGELVAADQFTIKVKYDNGTGDLRFVVVFKSALTSFEVIE